MSYINEKAMQATKAAHISGGVPVTEIRLPEISEESVGALIYFFEYACGGKPSRSHSERNCS